MIPLLFVCAAAESRGSGAPDWLILLTSATFPGHDHDLHACVCEHPMRPYPRCPAHRGRASAFAHLGRPLGPARR